MSKKITIDLSAESCEYAAEWLSGFAHNLNLMLDEVCRRLAEIGIQEASAHLAGLAHGNEDATIDPTPVKIASGYKIVMSGEDVYFVEFGTGDQANAHGYTPNVPVGWGTKVNVW